MKTGGHPYESLPHTTKASLLVGFWYIFIIQGIKCMLDVLNSVPPVFLTDSYEDPDVHNATEAFSPPAKSPNHLND